MGDRYTPQEMLAKLVAFPTVSRNSNLPLIEFVEDYLAGWGVQSTRVPDETGEKSNLYAVVGPQAPGGVILSGHTDVVPTDGQDWVTDPFTLTEKDDKLFGRGSCDMKGFVALGLAAVPDFLERGLKRPVQLALSYDEEVGCLGAPSMVAAMGDAAPPASVCIVGEPSMMKVVNGHKGTFGLFVDVRGHEVHSSILHTGVSAVMRAARMVTWLEDQMAANKAAATENPFEPPYTTLHVGTIKGGTAGNITAKDCSFQVDIRMIPTENADDWMARVQAYAAAQTAEMQKIHPDTGIDIRVRSHVPACRTEPEGVAEALARRLTGDNGQHVVSYATEAGQFQDGGYSTVICGPGDIAQAHQPNEFILKSQLEAGAKFMARLADDLAA